MREQRPLNRSTPIGFYASIVITVTKICASESLPSPVSFWTLAEELREAVMNWSRGDGLAGFIPAGLPPNGTLLLRTGSVWDCLIGFCIHRDGHFTPGLLFKNPIPLWRYLPSYDDGIITLQAWSTERRRILIHNPGLGGVLGLLDQAVENSRGRLPN